VWSDGSLAAITKTVIDGVSHPRNYTGVMPPKGGAELSDADTAAVAAYVWAIGHVN
jgi:mono/diheme cytochrome c family protein